MEKVKFKRKRFKLLKKIFLLIIFFTFIYFIGSRIKLSHKYIKFLTNTYLDIKLTENPVKENTIPVVKDENIPQQYQVYIYNTHPKEIYSYQKLNNYNLDYNVNYAAHMFSFYLEDEGIGTLVEDNDITAYMNSNNMNYYESYLASRHFLEQSYAQYPDLEIFIDLHRDAAPYEATTTTIDGKKYARVLFILGLENPNYVENSKLINYLNDKLKSFEPSLTRGIMEKEGDGVDGVYNQDFNSHVILIEVGGSYNYIDEVDNTLKVLAKIIKEYIKTGEEV